MIWDESSGRQLISFVTSYRTERDREISTLYFKLLFTMWCEFCCCCFSFHFIQYKISSQIRHQALSDWNSLDQVQLRLNRESFCRRARVQVMKLKQFYRSIIKLKAKVLVRWHFFLCFYFFIHNSSAVRRGHMIYWLFLSCAPRETNIYSHAEHSTLRCRDKFEFVLTRVE